MAVRITNYMSTFQSDFGFFHPFVKAVCLSLCLLALPVHSEKMLLAAENSWPPFSNKNGFGLSRTIIEQALKGSGYKLEFVVVPYARALHMTINGQVDGCFNVTRQANTQAEFIFGNTPLLKAQASYYYPSDTKHVYQSIDEIPNGTSIGLISGYEYGDQYERNRHRFHEVRVASQKQIIGMLVSHRIPMAIMFDKVAAYTLKEMKLPADIIVKGHVNHVSDIYVAFSRQRHGVQGMVNALDKGLRRLQQ